MLLKIDDIFYFNLHARGLLHMSETGRLFSAFYLPVVKYHLPTEVAVVDDNHP